MKRLRRIDRKILLLEQVEEFLACQVEAHFFQGREGEGYQDFNDETEDRGIDPASGNMRTRGRRMAFFSRKHADEQNASHRADNGADHRQGHGLFFQLPEVVGLLLRLLDQGIRLIDDIQPGEIFRQLKWTMNGISSC